MKQRIQALEAFASTDIALDPDLQAADAIEKVLLISFLGAVFSFLILGGLAYHATIRYADSLSRVIHVQKALTSLAEIRATLSKTESRYRAYAITGDRSYLIEQKNLSGQIAALKQTIRNLEAENEPVVPPAAMQELEQRITRRSELLNRLIAIHDADPSNITDKSDVITDGVREMATIESSAMGMETRLADAGLRDTERTRRQGDQMIALFGAMVVATIVFLALMFREIRLEVRQRKIIQHKLIDREKNLQAILGAAVDGIIVIDTRGIVQSMNPAAERIFGYRAVELIGNNVSMLMPEPYRSQHDGYLEHYLRTGEKRIIGIGREVSGRRKNGEIFPMELAVGETRAGGERRFIGTVRDISIRKQAESEQRQLVSDLSAANEELKSFSYVVSHDLKAPLRAIGSLAAWLMEDHGGKLGEEGNRQMELLIGRVQRMDRLIDGILEYSRAGRPNGEIAMADAGDVLADALELIDVPPNMAIEIETDLPSVRADPIRLQQIFQNLIGNAIKHANVPGGHIRIGCADLPDAWEFHVCDNGPGIEPRNFERIFQLFQTLVPKDVAENTGVGLAIVKKIVESYGGKVWVESEKEQGEQGTCFFFCLPKRQPSRAHDMENGDAHR